MYTDEKFGEEKKIKCKKSESIQTISQKPYNKHGAKQFT
jgi:hypothetical protein